MNIPALYFTLLRDLALVTRWWSLSTATCSYVKTKEICGAVRWKKKKFCYIETSCCVKCGVFFWLVEELFASHRQICYKETHNYGLHNIEIIWNYSSCLDINHITIHFIYPDIRRMINWREENRVDLKLHKNNHYLIIRDHRKTKPNSLGNY